MTNEDRILKGLAEVYKQNQELNDKLTHLQQFLTDALGTPTHNYPRSEKPGKRPWEQGWSKDKQNTNTESDEGFKL